MRRQTHPHGLAVRWPMRPVDIDPLGLPVHYHLEVDTGSDCERKARDEIELRPEFIRITHEISGAPAVSRDISLDDFTGITIRVDMVGECGSRFAVSVNLHHPDPKLCFPLHMSYDNKAAGRRWQEWGRVLKLPVLLPGDDGEWREPYERFGKLSVNLPFGRPARLGLASRRSAMSSVREIGDPAKSYPVAGHELIARG